MSCRLPPFSEGRLTPPITTGMLAVINGAVAGTSTGLCQAMKCAPKLSPWAQAQSHLRLATLCLRRATSHVRVKASQRSATCAAWAMRTSGGWLVVGTPVTNPVSLVACMRSENIKFFSVDVDGFLAQYAVAPANILWKSPKVRACMCLIVCVRLSRRVLSQRVVSRQKCLRCNDPSATYCPKACSLQCVLWIAIARSLAPNFGSIDARANWQISWFFIQLTSGISDIKRKHNSSIVFFRRYLVGENYGRQLPNRRRNILPPFWVRAPFSFVSF